MRQEDAWGAVDLAVRLDGRHQPRDEDAQALAASARTRRDCSLRHGRDRPGFVIACYRLPSTRG